ncbi:SMC-Scp complex subunit ScpB [Dyella acidiphila]|uniref:SMC-Scp complex subunit ScpB n=1 Tax=Dyella acidiphila TaxID=2775866 RepID=A0ABR9GAC9_9GAMM|nr:SMC-Scp complex subunit ScpB [Dyella acidiphila]MBE1160992.1 SMC-Scp complex subunit ScpB [Dyella acidiphila]
MQIEQLKPIIEAALLAASQPLSVAQLGELFVEEDEVDRAQIAMALEMLADDCQGRGVELKEVGSGFRYQVCQEVHPWVSRMWSEKPSRYSRALLETLALIAYRQPITRPEIEQIRGVVVSSNIVKTLEEREWVRVVGHRDVPGKPALYATTRGFLDYFNLKSLDELPTLAEIRDMEDPQLRLDNDPLPPRVIKDLPIDPDGDDADAGSEELEERTLEERAEQAHTEEEHAKEEQTEAATAEEAGSSDTDSQEHTPHATAATETAASEAPADATHHSEPPPHHAEDLAPHHGEPAAEADAVNETSSTADEAADHADADDGSAKQDTEEYRA